MTPGIFYKSSNLFDVMSHQKYTFMSANLKTIRILLFPLRYCANVVKLNVEHEGSMSVLRKSFKIQLERTTKDINAMPSFVPVRWKLKESSRSWINQLQKKEHYRFLLPRLLSLTEIVYRNSWQCSLVWIRPELYRES